MRVSSLVAATLVLAACTAHALDNPGFEMPDKGAGGWEYFDTMDAGELAAAVWTHTGAGAGLSGANGPWKCDSTSPDPLGDQFAFLQAAASISQDLTNLVIGATYTLGFYESYRTAQAPSNDLNVVLDEGLGTEVQIYTNAAVTNPTWEARETAEFVATKSSYTLTFRATHPLGAGDRSTLIDGVVTNVVDLPGPPTVTTLSPADDAVGVLPWTDLVLTFDEAIAIGAGDITITNLTDALGTVIPASNAQVSVAGRVVTINPTDNLLPLKDYAVRIDATAIKDLIGNPFAGITDNTNWNFTTAQPDTDAPTVTALRPEDDALGVRVDTDLVMTFDELVRKGTGNIRIKETIGDTVVETIDVASAGVTVSGAEVTINPTGELALITHYYVEVDSGAIEDLPGNDFAGIAGTSTWNFVTVAQPPISYHHITGDADSDIGSRKTYTHTLDFGTGTPGALVNGVQFAAYNNAANGTLNFSRTVSSGTFNDHGGNGGHNVSGGLANLLRDMYFNGGCAAGGTTTWTLSGLTAGVEYDTRIYVRQWGPSANRLVTLVFDPDGPGHISDATGLISEDEATSVGMAADNDAYYIRYVFTAVAGQNLTITATQNNVNNSWHLYGLSNEELPPPDTTGPVVSNLAPADDASGVLVVRDLVVTFDEDIVAGPGSITITNLTDALGTVIPVSNAQVSVVGSVLTIDPTADLEPLKDYAVLIDTNAVKDLNGNPFAGITNNTTWNFTTGEPDITAPTVTALAPADDAVDVATDADLAITFDEDVRKGTGNIEIRESIGDAVVETIDVTSAAVMIGGADVTVNPIGDLAAITGYYVEIAPGAIEDLSGNPFAGIAGKSAWNFTTREGVISYHEVSNDADSGISSNKTYTHAIDFGSGGAATVNGVVFGTDVNVATNGRANSGSRTYGPNPHPGNAPPAVTGAITDLFKDFRYNGPDRGYIELTGLVAGRAYDLRLYDRSYGYETSARTYYAGYDLGGDGSVEFTTPKIDQNRAALSPPGLSGDVSWAMSYVYRADASGTIRVIIDLADDQTGTYHLYGLTNEELPDTAGPRMVTLSPADDATGVLVVRDLVVTFDEDVVAGPGSIAITNLTDATGIVIPASNAQVTVAGPVLTIDPTADLDPLKQYAVLIDTNALVDLAGNPFGGITNSTTWNFTTAEIDLTAPTIATLSPADDADDMSTGADLAITFDEEIRKGAGNIQIKRTDDDTVFETIAVTAVVVTVDGPGVTIDPTGNLAVATGYYVEIAPGAIEDLSGNDFAGIAGNSTWNFTTLPAGLISYHRIADDADSGIAGARTYSHAIDFGAAGAATVNGVVFGTDVNVAAGGRANTGNRTYGPNQAAGPPPGVTGGVAEVFRDFRYNGPDLGYVELTGLTVGRMYDLRLYDRAWDYEGFVRTYHAAYDLGGDGSVEFTTPKIDQNRATLAPPWLPGNVSWAMSYVYRADASGKIRVIIDLADDQTGTYHLYGLTNEELPTDGSIYWAGVGVSNVTSTSAWARASVNTNVDEAVLVWDRTDQGTGSPDDWAGSVALGARAPGVVTGEVTNLLADTRYTFRFYGTNSLPTNGWSAATTFATTFSSAQTPVFTNATTSAWNSITLGWQDNASNETAYILQRSTTGSGGPYGVTTTLVANVTSYRDVVRPGATYYYQLAATNAANGSATDFAACRVHVTVPAAPAFRGGVLFRDDFSQTDATFNQNVEDNLSLFGSVVDSMTQDGPTYTTSGAIGGEDGNATWRVGGPNSSAFIPSYDFALDAALTNAGWFTASLKGLTPGGSWAALAVFDNPALSGGPNISESSVGLGALFGPGSGGVIQVWSQGNMVSNSVTTPAPPFDVTFAITNVSGFGPGNSFDYEILVDTTVVESGTKTNVNTTVNYLMVEGWRGTSSVGELEVRTEPVPPDRGTILIVR